MLYRLAFSSLRGLNVSLAEEILLRLSGEEEFFTMPSVALRSLMGFRSRLFDDEVRARALAEAREEEKFVVRNDISPLYFRDCSYPSRLRECEDAPVMLYSYGDCRLDDAYVIGIVGTRHSTVYGENFVADLVAGLKAQLDGRLVVVSGLAYGIDACAHKVALDNGVATVGVLAHGLNTIYPAAHRELAARMVREGGALVTEYRSSDAIHKGNFLARNRIVAGLCDCLLVVESDVRGGALVTARIASDYSRDVFALPGRVSDRYSRGCNQLIASNVAQLVSSASDIIDHMRWPRRAEEGSQTSLFDAEPELNEVESAVIDTIRRKGEANMNEIMACVDLPMPRLMGMLVDLEFRNLIVAIPGARYRVR
ncbi:MAG: DNA-protecting protein DprA [Bacteroides sp.]|nr:DNA-protecting protein DprA [Bacteroides sp.]